MSHYYTNDDSLKEEELIIEFRFHDQSFRFHSNSGIFSKSHIDQGSILLLEYLTTDKPEGRILDLGCGYGVLGIVLKKLYPDLEVTMSDVNHRALAAAHLNCATNKVDCAVVESDGYQQLEGSYDLIISNPPIRAGKELLHRIVKEAGEHLLPEGALILVVRKQQGAFSLLDYLVECYGVAEIVKKHKGYCILRANKR